MGMRLRLQDYPVPPGNNAFGWHYLPRLADAVSETATRGCLLRMKRTGATWVKMLTSPGGDLDWTPGRAGAAEMTLSIAQELDLGVQLRIFGSPDPPYINSEVEGNLRHIARISNGLPIYMQPKANEPDAEHPNLHPDEVAAMMRSVADWIDGVWTHGGGKLIPCFPPVGYGGGGYNWFEELHGIGRGDCLDRCAVDVHPYAKAAELWQPFDPTYIAGIPYTDADYTQMGTWAWNCEPGSNICRPLSMVNAARLHDAKLRQTMRGEGMLKQWYNSGFFTHWWALTDLWALGHTNTPLVFGEYGKRIGEMVPARPRTGPHEEMVDSLQEIDWLRRCPWVLATAKWLFIGQSLAATEPAWEDQCAISPRWDKKYYTTSPWPADWDSEIITPGQTPLIDHLEATPVEKGKPVKTKLCPHIQVLDTPTLEAIRVWQPPVIKTMDLDIGNLQDLRTAAPQAIIVARQFRDTSAQDFESDPERLGAAYALEYADVIARGLVDVVESFNEPLGNKPPDMAEDVYRARLAALDRFQNSFITTVQRLSQGQVRAGVFVLPTGNWGFSGEPQLDPDWFPLTFSHGPQELYIITHEYTWYSWDWEWGARWQRYMHLMGWAAQQGYQLIISEFGYTEAVLEHHPDQGWYRTDGSMGLTEAVVMAGFRRYDQYLQMFPWILGACYFTCGANNGWATHEGLKQVLYAAQTPVPPLEAPAEDYIQHIAADLPHSETDVYAARSLDSIQRIIMHHTASIPTATPEAIARYHVIERGYPGIAYHYLVAADGTVYETNTPDTISYHAAGQNGDTLGVCLIGDFTAAPPPAAQWDAAIHLVSDLCERYSISNVAANVLGHREVGQTQCPGHAFDMALFREQVALSNPPPPLPPPPDPGGETMDSVIACDLADANLYGVTILPAAVQPSQGYWAVAHFRHLDVNDGRHNFYCDVLKAGVRQYGTQIQASWPPGGPPAAVFTIEKPSNEPGGNMAINKHDSLTFRVVGAPSEAIAGVSTQFPGDPATGSSLYHQSFDAAWEWRLAGAAPGGDPDIPPPATVIRKLHILVESSVDDGQTWTTVLNQTLD